MLQLTQNLRDEIDGLVHKLLRTLLPKPGVIKSHSNLPKKVICLDLFFSVLHLFRWRGLSVIPPPEVRMCVVGGGGGGGGLGLYTQGCSGGYGLFNGIN